MTATAGVVIAVVGAVAVNVIFIAVVAWLTILVQRKFGSKWLWVVWLAPPVLVTGILLLTQVDYTVHDLFSPQVLEFATAWLLLTSWLSGLTVWHTVVEYGSRRRTTASNGLRDLPLSVSMGRLVDARGLTGIVGCYQRLLTTYATALGAAPRHPYPSLLQGFFRTMRGFLPSAVVEARERVRQMGLVPNVLTVDLVGAEYVLKELDTLTIGQLSAIEECHRLNIRRLRQNSIFRWRWRTITALISVISALGLAAEYVGVLKLKDMDLGSLIASLNIMGWDTPSMILRGITGAFMVVLLFFIIGVNRYVPILQRLQAFEDILAIAKAYRKGHSETADFTARGISG